MPAGVVAALMVALIAVVVLLVRPPGPLDDPRPALQRDGLLREGPVLEEDVAGLQLGDRAVILLFDREQPGGSEWEQWRTDVTAEGADLIVLTPGVSAHGELIDVIPMPVPVDGGPPVGYAVIDQDRQVRYVTLDPQYLLNAFEVNVITGAVS